MKQRNKNQNKTQTNKKKNSIKTTIRQFWEGIKIPHGPSDFDFVVYLIIQYPVMFQILWSCFA